MNAPVFEDELLQYFSMLNRAEQQSVLDMLKTFIASRKEEYGPVTLEQYNKELEEADAEIEAGEYVTHEEVKRRLLRK
ncbi:MAG: hypothetical protein ACR2KZ_12210 [Segetibacter sp.]